METEGVRLFNRKEIKLKKLKEVMLSGMAKASVNAAKMNVNSTCAFLVYQPQIPSAVERLKKFQVKENEGK